MMNQEAENLPAKQEIINEELLTIRNRRRVSEVSMRNRMDSLESGIGDSISSVESSLDISTSGFRPFNRAPGANHMRPRNVPNGDNGSRGLANSPPEEPNTWSPWASNVWSPYNVYPWRPLDHSPLTSWPDINNNSLFASLNNDNSSIFVSDNRAVQPVISPNSSSESSSSSSSDEDDQDMDNETGIPPINPHWLSGYVRSFPPGTLRSQQLTQVWQVVQEATTQSTMEPWIPPFQDILNLHQEFNGEKN
ncbi:uncharacterized protein [Halyomorpha halys]|uniref:uncharacterized protein n=1 Tax=Halyomorpha halys TaxID=286706 RepID=UPI0006D510C5